MNKIIFVSVCLFLTLSVEKAVSQYSKTKWLNGIWTGIGYQPDAMNQTSWKIVLEYNYAQQEIRIDYPSFPCGGSLQLVEANENRAVFIENIIDGKDKCLDKEKVIITKIDDKFVSISYFYPEKIKGVVSFLVLEKVAEK